MSRKWLVSIVSSILLSAVSLATTATTTALHCTADTFVYNPGTGAAWTNANATYDYGAGNNFGGAGSLSVASSTASTQKGEFDTLLKFNFSSLSGRTVTQMTMTLNLSSGNSSAAGIFNYPGSAGYFNLSWFSSSWVEGVDAPHTGTYTGGVTYNSLQDLLADEPATYLQTFYFDNVAGPHTFTLDLISSTYAGLLSAISAGETVTLYLTAADGSDVAFNLTGNKNAYVTVTSIPEPMTLALLMVGSVLSFRMRRRDMK